MDDFGAVSKNEADLKKEGKVTITLEDVDGVDTVSTTEIELLYRVPIWWRILSFLLIFIPPVLYLFTIFQLTYLRKRDLRIRHSYALHNCFLLLVSGIIWLFLFMMAAIWTPHQLLDFKLETPSLSISSFPKVPSESALSAKDIAQQFLPLVAIVHLPKRSMSLSPGGSHALGTATLVMANSKCCLFVTSKHVIEALIRRPNLGESVGITLQDGQEVNSTVVGIHKRLDLALLWAKRNPEMNTFAQPVRHFGTIEVGEMVFVIGHPEGFEFSMADGLIAQKRGGDMLQISVPISPGNSGGPVFDCYGNLLAIVKSSIDKTKSPQAEELNFALRADDLLCAEEWKLDKKGRIAINIFSDFLKE